MGTVRYRSYVEARNNRRYTFVRLPPAVKIGLHEGLELSGSVFLCQISYGTLRSPFDEVFVRFRASVAYLVASARTESVDVGRSALRKPVGACARAASCVTSMIPRARSATLLT